MEKDASLRRHIGPRLSILLGQHKRHEIDLAKSPVAHDTVVAISIVFLIIRTKKKIRKKKRKKVFKNWGWQAWDDVIAYTKCLIAVPIPPFWTPFTYEAVIMPDKKGSSEKLSKLYEQYTLCVSREITLWKDRLTLPPIGFYFELCQSSKAKYQNISTTHSLNVTSRSKYNRDCSEFCILSHNFQTRLFDE